MSVRLDSQEGYSVQEELDYLGVHDDADELEDFRDGWGDYVESFETCQAGKPAKTICECCRANCPVGTGDRIN